MSGGGAFGNDDRGPHTFYLNPCILSALREHPTPPTPPGYVPFHHILPTPACRTSGIRNGLLTSFFSFFVQGVRLASPSSLLPAEPFSKGLVLYVCFAHLAQVRVCGSDH